MRKIHARAWTETTGRSVITLCAKQGQNEARQTERTNISFFISFFLSFFPSFLPSFLLSFFLSFFPSIQWSGEDVTLPYLLYYQYINFDLQLVKQQTISCSCPRILYMRGKLNHVIWRAESLDISARKLLSPQHSPSQKRKHFFGDARTREKACQASWSVWSESGKCLSYRTWILSRFGFT